MKSLLINCDEVTDWDKYVAILLLELKLYNHNLQFCYHVLSLSTDPEDVKIVLEVLSQSDQYEIIYNYSTSMRQFQNNALSEGYKRILQELFVMLLETQKKAIVLFKYPFNELENQELLNYLENSKLNNKRELLLFFYVYKKNYGKAMEVYKSIPMEERVLIIIIFRVNN